MGSVEQLKQFSKSNSSHSSWSSGLIDNPLFTAGFGLMGTGVALASLRQGLKFASSVLQRRLIVSLEISNKDRSYDWVLSWLAQRSASSVAGWNLRSPYLSVETVTKSEDPQTSARPRFNIIAGTGAHYFRYQGAWIKMIRSRETKAMHMMTHTPWETITFTTLSRDREVFASLLEEARDFSIRRDEGKLVVNTAWGIEWRPFGKPRRKRPIESVILEEGVSERVQSDLQTFMERRQWYTARGIPYRRGYLLYGPPGSGKTSFIQALAAAHNYDVCLLNLSERGLTDDKLIHLLSNAPDRSFILMEDIDAAFNKRVQTSEDGYQSSVTFSGFLNALDGVASGEERICFLTTNHVERLDSALIRPGRVDLKQFVGDARPNQARRLFLQFYGGGSIEGRKLALLADKLETICADQIAHGKTTSMAALQGHFIRNGAADAIESCDSIFTLSAPV